MKDDYIPSEDQFLVKYSSGLWLSKQFYCIHSSLNGVHNIGGNI